MLAAVSANFESIILSDHTAYLIQNISLCTVVSKCIYFNIC